MDAEPTYAQLKEKVRLYDVLIENSGGLMGLFDQNGTLLIANKLNTAYWGGKSDDFIGKSMEDLFPKSAEIFMPRLKDAFKSGKPATYEDQFRIFSGTRWFHTDYIPIYNENNEVYAVKIVTLDITERKLGQKALHESEEKFRTLIDQAADILFVYDIDGRIQDVNSAAVHEYGYSRQELLSMNLADLDPDCLDRDKRKEFISRFDLNKPYRFEARHKRKDGTEFPIETSVTRVMIDGKPCIMGLFRDISIQKSVKERLESNLVFLQTLIDTIPNPIFYKDLEGRYLGGNRAFAEEICGVKTEEIIGSTIYELPMQISKKDMDGHVRKNEALIKKGGTQVYESKVKCNDHKDRDFIFYKSVFPDAEGNITGIVCIMLDITDRKKGEEERTLLQKRLQQAQKLESIGTLAGGIAHDFNNILFPILAHSEMAMMRLPSDSPVQQNVQQIHRAGERAKDMVHQILTFARQRENKRTPIKITTILKETVKLLRSTIPSTINIGCDISVEQDIVLADPTQINQIIMNLCTNAVHAMEEKGGSLEIILANENLDSESLKKIPELEQGRYIRLAVKDTGHGISPELIDKIFEPYFTTKGPGKGTGMGLSIVHGIVKNYGGEIAVQSKVNQGTSFHVYLPLFEVDSNIHEDIQDSYNCPAGAERILIVDDEKVAVDTLKSMLEWLGYKVTERTSSIEALEAFRYNPKGFDLVITDHTMPNMTGKNLAKEMIAIRKDIPIILCTGFSEQIDEKSAKEIGVRAFLMKPVVMGQIAKTIRAVLDEDG